MSDGEDRVAETHRGVIRDAMTEIKSRVSEIGGDVQRMTREVDTSTSKLTTRVDAIALWQSEAERRLREQEATAARMGVYITLAAALTSGVVSLVVALVVRAVSR